MRKTFLASVSRPASSAHWPVPSTSWPASSVRSRLSPVFPHPLARGVGRARSRSVPAAPPPRARLCSSSSACRPPRRHPAAVRRPASMCACCPLFGRCASPLAFPFAARPFARPSRRLRCACRLRVCYCDGCGFSAYVDSTPAAALRGAAAALWGRGRKRGAPQCAHPGRERAEWKRQSSVSSR